MIQYNETCYFLMNLTTHKRIHELQCTTKPQLQSVAIDIRLISCLLTHRLTGVFFNFIQHNSEGLLRHQVFCLRTVTSKSKCVSAQADTDNVFCHCNMGGYLVYSSPHTNTQHHYHNHHKKNKKAKTKTNTHTHTHQQQQQQFNNKINMILCSTNNFKSHS